MRPPAASRAEALAAIDSFAVLEPYYPPYRRAAVELSLQLDDPARAASFGSTPER